ncbi:MAG: alpha-L-fucosidase [Lachnospiraceae bacterium]|nr:alpha-L-fucosidase [Lachnospiraceae bacterium]
MINYIREAAAVAPSKRQLLWYDTGFYGFIHFGMNTFTDREWGDGTEPESLFNPEKLDCAQWARSLKEAGMKGMILTAKHHDGFCLWPSKYTEHSVKNSPCKRDVVGEAAKACREAGLRFGVYLSPWDRNSSYYGSPEYNDYYCNQLEELLTGYGELFCIWFDGACGEGPNGRKQVYDFPRYVELVRKYQPDAVIFYDKGPDVRWCGNEAGTGRLSEWAVVPGELCTLAERQTGPGPMAEEGDLGYLYNTDSYIGGMSSILYSKGLVFAPAEVDTSIRPGWFWHSQEEPRPLKTLFRIYMASVGGNACLNLNVPPNRDGLLDERDVKRLKELRALLDQELGHPLEARVEKRPGGYATQPEYLITLEKPVARVKYVELMEDIAKGQRVESFRVEAMFPDGNQFPLFQGTTVGNRKICQLTDPFAEQNRLLDDSGDKIDRLLVKVTAARDEVFLKSIRIF